MWQLTLPHHHFLIMNSPAFTEKFTGVNFGFYARNGYYRSKQAKIEVDHMAQLNVRWVCVIATVFREHAYATTEFRDFEGTPDDAELRGIIDHIHSRGMRVKLRPMLEGLDGSDRMCVQFPQDRERIPGRAHDFWKRWFASLKHRTRHYARIAQETGCEMYGLDSELDYTVDQHEHWKQVIDVARDVYDGPIDSCHTGVVDFYAQLQNPDHWWYHLDSLSRSGYFKVVHKPQATVAELVAGFQPVVAEQQRIAEKFGKLYFFGECGCPAVEGAAMDPAGYHLLGGYAPDEQANYLEAILQSFAPEPWWRGIYLWKWDEQNKRPNFTNDPRGDKGYTVWNKTAAEVLRRYYGQMNAATQAATAPVTAANSGQLIHS